MLKESINNTPRSSLGDRDFDRLRKLITKHTGITVAEGKRQLLMNRLGKRLRVHNFSNFDEYCELIDEGEDTDEVEVFVNSVTTNLTSFFREQHHFDYLRDTALPELIAERRPGRRLRIWSAACSTGEEPYCLAIVLQTVVQDIDGWDAKILATDLDTSVLNIARSGIYSNDRIEKVPQEYRRKWFDQCDGRDEKNMIVSPKLKKVIQFNQLNLMGSWPMRGLFDIVFCRNVIIYFDKPTQKRLFDRIADQMAVGGYLFIGHSESLYNVTDRFTLLGKTVYRKVK